MENITINETIDAHTGETIQSVTIQKGENNFTWMLKSTYDAMQAEQSTPNLPN
jgi:hypothetical protein